MKPAPFRYVRPGSLDEVVTLLAQRGGEAKLLAGGQSLVPMLNMRLVRPAILVDLNTIPDLDRIEPTSEGGVAIGALVRHADLVGSPVVRERAPLLAEAARHIGHAAIRNRGTLGGSVAHADPAAELPAVLVALDAVLTLRGRSGARSVPAIDFFRGLLSTALETDEILTEIRVPPQPPGWGFAELARRPGDFALAGIAAVVRAAADDPGRCERARLVGFGVGDRPVRFMSAEGILAGARLDAGVAEEAAAAAGPASDPPGDVHASSEYRRHLATVLAERALLQAFDRACGAPRPHR
jgi:CO/xanthine dehydrogenase FAD-binding subunit